MAVESIGSLIPTKIPGLSDQADIQAAFKAYHYGSYTYDTAETNPANLVNPSIAKTIYDLQQSTSGTVTLTGTQTLTNKTLTSPTVSGLYLSDSSIVIEGASANNFETTLTVADPTDDRTITFPNATGDVVLNTANQTLTNKTIALGSNTVSGTLSDFNTALTGADFASIAGSETLTNKTLTAPVINVAFNAQTGTSYTAALSDSGKIVEILNSSPIIFYVPTNSTAFPVGSQITILQTGTGQITVAATTPLTTTINATPGSKLRTQWSSATLVKRATELWVLMGDLSA
jgi:hypothetical protein